MNHQTIPLLCIGLGSFTFFSACKKEEAPVPDTPTSITSICIGTWRADSSFIPQNSEYNHHPTGTFQFTNNGLLHVSWPDGGVGDYDFRIGEEVMNTTPSEIGRSLIWVHHVGLPTEYEEGVLLVYQSSSEAFLLWSDDIGPTGPQHSLATVNEYLIVDGDPVFDYWAKCFRQ